MNYMRDKGIAVLRNGYPIIPLVVGEKRPAIDGWRTIDATEQTVAGWSGGIGIRTGTVLFVDIDIPNPVADRLRLACLELLGPAPIRIGRAPKLGMMYRAAAIFKTRLSTVYQDTDKNRCAIEALADGRQFVAWNIHPDTQEPYYWLEGMTPETMPLADLTVVSESQVAELFRVFDRIAAEEGWVRLSGSSATGRGDPTGDEMPAARRREPLGLTDMKIREALMAVPNDRRFDAREDWFKIGCAVHHETNGSEFGRDIWNEWSAEHPSHDEGNFRKAWDSMGMRYGQEADEPITFRYILGILKEQKRVELTAKLDEIGWGIELASSLNDLEKIAFTLAGLDIDPMRREVFASDIKESAKRLGIKLSIITIRQMLKPRPDDVETPDWLVGWVFLQETEQFYNTKSGEYIGKTAFDFSFMRYLDDTLPSKFAMQTIKIPVYYMTAYLPGERAVYTDAAGLIYLNTYKEFAPATPIVYSERDRANIEIVKNHAVHLFGPLDRDIAILHSALAYVVQTRKRINWLLLIQGAEEVGKTFYARLLRTVLGEGPHVHELSSNTLTESNFSEWAEGHLVVYVEELMVHGKRYDVLNKMKPYITNKYVSVHPKFRKPHDALNTTSYFAFTNFRDAIPIDTGDTRYFVMLSRWQNGTQVKQFKARNPQYYARLWDTLTESPGALRRWLLEYELHPDFDPDNRAPPSQGRNIVIGEAKPDLEYAVEDLLESGTVPGVSEDLVVAHLLRQALADRNGIVPTPEAVRTILRRLQFTPANARRVKITINNTQQDFYCWSRNQEILASSTSELRERILALPSM